MIIKKKLYLQKNNSIMMFFFYPFRHYPPPETKEEARARLKFFFDICRVGSFVYYFVYSFTCFVELVLWCSLSASNQR